MSTVQYFVFTDKLQAVWLWRWWKKHGSSINLLSYAIYNLSLFLLMLLSSFNLFLQAINHENVAKQRPNDGFSWQCTTESHAGWAIPTTHDKRRNKVTLSERHPVLSGTFCKFVIWVESCKFSKRLKEPLTNQWFSRFCGFHLKSLW